MTNIFTAPTKELTAQQMADSLPQGRAWGNKNIGDSNTRLLINSLAVVHNSTQRQVEKLDYQFRIENTSDLITEWEKSVDLPSDCSESVGTLEQRRTAVVERFRRKEIVTLAEMQTYIDNKLPDFDITLYPGEAYTGYPERATYEIDTLATDSYISTTDIDMTPFLGQVVEVGIWLKNDAAAPMSGNKTLEFRDSPGGTVYGTWATGVIPNAWTYYKFPITVPATPINPDGAFFIDPVSTGAGEKIYFDDLKVGATTIAPIDANWQGTSQNEVLSYSTTFPGSVNKKFLIVAGINLNAEGFRYEFNPMPFTGGVDFDALVCFMNKVIPANVILLTYYT